MYTGRSSPHGCASYCDIILLQYALEASSIGKVI